MNIIYCQVVLSEHREWRENIQIFHSIELENDDDPAGVKCWTFLLFNKINDFESERFVVLLADLSVLV